MSSPSKNPDVEKVSSFVSNLIVQMMDGNGMQVDILKITGVIGAGKRLKSADGKQVMVEVLRQVETKHPELWDLLLVSASEAVKERVRKALVPRPEVEGSVER